MELREDREVGRGEQLGHLLAEPRRISRRTSEGVLEVVYVSSSNVLTTRRIRLNGIVMDRSETLLDCTDLDKEEERRLRLHRIHRARVVD